MTTKTIHYANRTELQAGYDLEHSRKFRPMETNWTNNNERDGFDVVYDDTPDVVVPLRKITERQLLDELAFERKATIV